MTDRFVFVPLPHRQGVSLPVSDYDGSGKSDPSVFGHPTNGAPRIVEVLHDRHAPGSLPFMPPPHGGVFVAIGDVNGSNGVDGVAGHAGHHGPPIAAFRPSQTPPS